MSTETSGENRRLVCCRSGGGAVPGELQAEPRGHQEDDRRLLHDQGALPGNIHQQEPRDAVGRIIQHVIEFVVAVVHIRALLRNFSARCVRYPAQVSCFLQRYCCLT